MKINKVSVKYSIFGNFEYIDNTPENVSRLYKEFEHDGFMPNMITLFKIEQPQNHLQQLVRPQLINIKDESKCVITILPERVDIETESNLDSSMINNYNHRLINVFELKINRIALNTSTQIVDLSDQELVILNQILTPPINYPGEENLIEYSSHRVSRKKIESLGELVNVGRNVISVPVVIDGSSRIDRIQISTDINTLGENTKERFDSESCKNFFKAAADVDRDIISSLEEIINERAC